MCSPTVRSGRLKDETHALPANEFKTRGGGGSWSCVGGVVGTFPELRESYPT